MPLLHSFLTSATRFLFFTGKGGVGKTSLAGAVGVALADAGRRVLVISTDPASNLSEVFGVKLGSNPRTIPGVPGAAALNLDPHEAAEAYRERILGPIRGVLPEQAIENITEQLSGACTTEIASFNVFARMIGDPAMAADYDHVILDTAPTGHTLRLLQLPAAWSEFIASNKTGTSCLGPLAGLESQRDVYARTVTTLCDPAQTTLVLVARPDEPSLEEAARAASELRSQGMDNQALIINAIFRAQESTDAVARQWQATAEAAMRAMPAGLTNLPRWEVPFRPLGTVGVERLRHLLASEAPLPSVGETAGGGEPDQGSFQDLAALVGDLRRSGRGVVMTMGKGGVGKTSVATRVAQMLADAGEEVLLATTDPADHITGRLEETPNLTVQAIDPKSELQRHVSEALAAAGDQLDDDARALLEEELRSPCVEEIAVFSAFARVIAQGRAQFVVVDTAPTGHTLLLLDTTEAYHREVSRNAKGLSSEVRELLPRLRDPAFTRVLLVTLPESTPVHEAAYLQEDLRRADIEPYAWVINRSLQGMASIDPLVAAKRADEAQYLREVDETLARRVAVVPYEVKCETLVDATPR